MRDPKLLAVAEIRRDFGIVDDVLAGQAHDVWTRSADIFAIDDGDALSFSSERPRSDRRSGATPKNDEIVFPRSLFPRG